MKKMMMLTTTAYMSERFNRENILLLEKMGYEVHVVANFDKGNPIDDEILQEFQTWIEQHHGKWISIPITRSPADVKGFRKSYQMTKELIKKHNYSFIHCHTPMGGVLGRLVGHNTKTKVIYTAHGFHFFTGAPKPYWMVYYPVEKFFGRWTDVLITINQEDDKRARRKIKAKKIVYVPGVGIDLPDENVDHPAVNIRGELGLKEDSRLLLSVGELNENKNHEVMIRALAKLISAGKGEDLHYLICGRGRSQEYLENLIAELKLGERVHLLGFRKDIPAVCKEVNAFVFPSKREGLSVALMEAVAAHLPIIASNARGNSELVRVGENGVLCMNNTVDEYVAAVEEIMSYDMNLVHSSSAEIIHGFTKPIVSDCMQKIYEDVTA